MHKAVCRVSVVLGGWTSYRQATQISDLVVLALVFARLVCIFAHDALFDAAAVRQGIASEGVIEARRCLTLCTVDAMQSADVLTSIGIPFAQFVVRRQRASSTGENRFLGRKELRGQLPVP
jgi:hypothetical protein